MLNELLMMSKDVKDTAKRYHSPVQIATSFVSGLCLGLVAKQHPTRIHIRYSNVQVGHAMSERVMGSYMYHPSTCTKLYRKKS